MSKFFKINVSVIIFDKNNRVLVQKRAMTEDVFPGLYGIPGGTVEMTDVSLDDALAREVAEEVGVKIKETFLLKNNIKKKEMYAILYLVYTAEHDSGEAMPMDETESVQWLDKKALENLSFTPTTMETIMLAYERRNTSSSV